MAAVAVDLFAGVGADDQLGVAALILAREAGGGEDAREVGECGIEGVQLAEIDVEEGDAGARVLILDAERLRRVESLVAIGLIDVGGDEQIVAIAVEVPVIVLEQGGAIVVIEDDEIEAL